MSSPSDDELFNSTRRYLDRIFNNYYEEDAQHNREYPEFPPALEKALFDPFSYRLQLTTGEVIYFHEAELVAPDWIHLKMDHYAHKENRFRFYRGVDVRISQIVWVQDDGE